MKTMRTNKMPVAMVLAAFWGLLLAATTASAAWTGIKYDATDPWGGDNVARVNNGANTDGYYYTSTKPGSGDWTLGYNMAPIAYDAAWVATRMNVWSAANVWFQTFGSCTNDYNTPSDLAIKIALSEAVIGATWTTGLTVYPSSSYIRMQYSTNGSDWTTVATYDAWAGDSIMVSHTYNLSFAPTSALYLRLNADPGAVWQTGGAGAGSSTVAFTVPEPMSLALLGLGSLACLRRRNRN